MSISFTNINNNTILTNINNQTISGLTENTEYRLKSTVTDDITNQSVVIYSNNFTTLSNPGLNWSFFNHDDSLNSTKTYNGFQNSATNIRIYTDIKDLTQGTFENPIQSKHLWEILDHTQNGLPLINGKVYGFYGNPIISQPLFVPNDLQGNSLLFTPALAHSVYIDLGTNDTPISEVIIKFSEGPNSYYGWHTHGLTHYYTWIRLYKIYYSNSTNDYPLDNEFSSYTDLIQHSTQNDQVSNTVITHTPSAGSTVNARFIKIFLNKCIINPDGYRTQSGYEQVAIDFIQINSS